MTQRNYNPSSGLPYQRVPDVRLSYPCEGDGTVVITEGLAVLSNGTPVALAGVMQDLRATLRRADMDLQYDLIDPASGQPMMPPAALAALFASGKVTHRMVMLVVTALVRTVQRDRDAAEAIEAAIHDVHDDGTVTIASSSLRDVPGRAGLP